MNFDKNTDLPTDPAHRGAQRRAQRRRQHAIVFSGNGYNAVYEVGVLKAILHGVSPSTEGAKIVPEIYAGTSVGAYNAAFMVSSADSSASAAAEKLERTWSTGVGPRFRGNPFEYFNPRTYWPNPLEPLADLSRDAAHVSRDMVRRAGDFLASSPWNHPLKAIQEHAIKYEWDILADAAPMNEHIRRNIDVEGIRRSNKELRITAANWRRGTTRVFRNRDFTDSAGYQTIAAAMAIPGAVPRQRVDLDEFVDGTMLMEHPLEPAIEARNLANPDRLTLHVIYLDPESDTGPLSDVQGSFPMVYRLFLLAFSRAVHADIKDIERTNRALKFLELLRDLDPGSEVMKLWTRLNQETKDRAEVEVHRYRSSKHLASLGDIFVGLSKERLSGLVEAGYKDAQNHDCKEAGCVLVSSG